MSSVNTTSKVSEKDHALMHEVADRYRDIIEERYQYENLKKHFQFPEGVDKSVVDDLREYFLNHLYPEAESRIKLSKGFSSLKGYISHPTKILKLAGSFTGGILKLGFFLPKAINAAFHSWNAYMNAKKLEIELVKIAKELKLRSPLSKEDILECIRRINKETLIKFSKEIFFLFESFLEATLLEKSVQLLEEIIEVMGDNPDTYSIEEKEAVIVGKQVIEEGHNLLTKYDPKLQKKIVDSVYEIEMYYLTQLYSKEEANQAPNN